MRYTIDKEGMKFTFDPHDHFDQPAEKIHESLGYLPLWVVSYGLDDTRKNLQKHMDKEYGFGLFEMTGGTVEPDLRHTYPEDPDLYPLLHVQFASGEEFIQWQHAICAMRQQPDEDWFITRMD